MTERDGERESSGIVGKLVGIQAGLKSPKDRKTSRYSYRSIEDINEAVKPLAAACGCAVTYTDDLREVGGRLAVVSTCAVTDGQEVAKASAWAILGEGRGMSPEQACGAASSYARKYAACGLFAIDDGADDPDARPVQQPAQQPAQQQAQQADPLTSARSALADACRRYAERYGADAGKVMKGVADRPDYGLHKEDPEWYLAVASEFDAA